MTFTRFKSRKYLVTVAFHDDAFASFILPLTRTTSPSHLIGESFQPLAHWPSLGGLVRVRMPQPLTIVIIPNRLHGTPH